MPRLKLLLSAIVSLCLLATPGLTRPAYAESATADPALPAGVHRVVMIEGVTEYRLDNGLQDRKSVV